MFNIPPLPQNVNMTLFRLYSMVVYMVVTWQFVLDVTLTAEMLANSSTVMDRFTPTVKA